MRIAGPGHPAQELTPNAESFPLGVFYFPRFPLFKVIEIVHFVSKVGK